MEVPQVTNNQISQKEQEAAAVIGHTEHQFNYLYEQRHVRLLHGLNGRLHQRDHGLQVVAVLPDEGPDVSQLVVLLPGDQTHQLLLPLLQDGHQAVEMVGQLLPLPLAILLRGDKEKDWYPQQS